MGPETIYYNNINQSFSRCILNIYITPGTELILVGLDFNSLTMRSTFGSGIIHKAHVTISVDL